MSKPAIETPTPIPAFAPIPSDFELDECVGVALEMAFAVELGLAVEVGVEVATVEDAGNGGGDVSFWLRRLQTN